MLLVLYISSFIGDNMPREAKIKVVNIDGLNYRIINSWNGEQMIKHNDDQLNKDFVVFKCGQNELINVYSD